MSKDKNSPLISSNSKINYVFTSGGTTSNPKFVFRSKEEDEINSYYLAKGLLNSGLDKNDRVGLLLSGGSLWGGMNVFTKTLEKLNCTIFQFGTYCSSEFIFNIAKKFNINVLLGLPLL